MQITIDAPQFSADLAAMREAFASTNIIAVAIPPLDIYQPNTRLTHVALATEAGAWTLRVDLWRQVIRDYLGGGHRLVMHDAAYTMETLDRHLGVTIEQLAGATFDTRVFTHLLDPRSRNDGGSGHSLTEAVRHYLAPDALSTENVVEPDLLGVRAHLTLSLFGKIAPMIHRLDLTALATKEHRLQAVVSTMARRGVRVDREYTQRLHTSLDEDAARWTIQAARYGVTSVQNPSQVASALLAMGEHLSERTESGALKVDKSVLLPLADLTEDNERIERRDPNPLAEAVLHARRAQGWKESYTRPFLFQTDGEGRIHPSITTLAARTGRMSLSRPALQQLPSKGHLVRRCIIADPGNVILSLDYKQIEMRVLAALCGDERMLDAILGGQDLHDFTASLVFGESFTSRQRDLSKQIGLGKVYGGSASTVSLQTGIPKTQVEPAMRKYDELFPGIKHYGKRLIADARRRDRFEVVNVHGRLLPLDMSRSFTATNYAVQSVARDILAESLIRLHDAGFGNNLLLPVHDEVVGQAPVADAAKTVLRMKEVMETDFMGVPILADAEVYGPSWGHGYGATA
ncbi:DNA polymerase I, thermostable [Microbacterium oxydans]|uniref:DNA-directed DNA polymerase n=3 Tax=Microbacterium TaxID=33882 RepID=A0A1H1WCM0_9MICO|nr:MULTISPECIES: DNA polymerase [Microbacterium]KJL25005.1 DNA polymerase I, thermostable [Microbacterium oxydans]SDS94146.1 DNA polymerase-1 [Microbacterium paraoxydans]